MASKKFDPDRKAKLEELQRAASRAERRRVALISGSVVLVVALIGAAVLFAVLKDTSRDPIKAITQLGVPAASATCDPTITDKASGSNVHVGPGTDKANVTNVKYTMVPPTSGEHFASPEFPNRKFYTAADRPQMEALVHNLEHGYTVLWYDNTVSQADQEILKKISDNANRSKPANDKFIVSAWDPAYGAFPSGRHIGLSHWSADEKGQTGNRLLCGKVSGAAIADFIKAHPRTSAPEPLSQ